MMQAPFLNATRRSGGEAEQKRIQLVTFQIDRHGFAVPVEQVWRVEALADFSLTRVPGAPDFLEGLINLRGRVIPVIDLKKRLGIAAQVGGEAPSGYPPKARLLIVEMEIDGQKDEKIGMIVDTVNDIRWFADAGLHPPPSIVAGINREYLLGVLEEETQLWIVLELRQVLNNAERSVLHNQVEHGQEAQYG
jgi:purine-binding chemotaxis protein CheW